MPRIGEFPSENKLAVHYSSKSSEWETPQWLFDIVNDAYHFSIDGAASSLNHKISNYWSKEKDAFKQRWSGERIWLNPPYDRELQPAFIRKAHKEMPGAKSILLLPARPDTAVWHDTIFPHADWVLFLKGRLKFVGAESAAPFPSALVSFGFSYRRELDRLGVAITTLIGLVPEFHVNEEVDRQIPF